MLIYRQGRVHIGGISFCIPDNLGFYDRYETESNERLSLITEDETIYLEIYPNQVAESALESIQSIFDIDDYTYSVPEPLKIYCNDKTFAYAVKFFSKEHYYMECAVQLPEPTTSEVLTVSATMSNKFRDEEHEQLVEKLVLDVVRSIK